MSPILALGTWGWTEILLVLFVVLLLFGSTKLPRLARSLGRSMTEFRKGLKGEPDDSNRHGLEEGDRTESRQDQQSSTGASP
ncbi:MAG: twin-arginine translocase TatA/TatE family subunit [Planctomycetota bacterium]